MKNVAVNDLKRVYVASNSKDDPAKVAASLTLQVMMPFYSLSKSIYIAHRVEGLRSRVTENDGSTSHSYILTMMESNDLNTFFRLDLFDRLVFKLLTK